MKRRTGESLKELFKKEMSPKESKRQDAKALKSKKKHTIYLSAEQSKKLRLYAAENDTSLSEIIEKLINKNL